MSHFGAGKRILEHFGFWENGERRGGMARRRLAAELNSDPQVQSGVVLLPSFLMPPETSLPHVLVEYKYTVSNDTVRSTVARRSVYYVLVNPTSFVSGPTRESFRAQVFQGLHRSCAGKKTKRKKKKNPRRMSHIRTTKIPPVFRARPIDRTARQAGIGPC